MNVTDFHVHGFDVSSYQPAGPDFRAGGREFAIFKATEGIGYFDKHFGANRARAHKQNLAAIGMYHFARPSKNPASDEAEWFLTHVTPPQLGEFAVLDYEVGAWSQAWINEWGRIVKDAGWKTVLYTYLGMLGTYDRSLFDLWIAAYGAHAPNVGWTFWQHTDGNPSVNGNDGPWDCSVFASSVSDLRTWAGTPLPVPVEDDSSFIYAPPRR